MILANESHNLSVHGINLLLLKIIADPATNCDVVFDVLSLFKRHVRGWLDPKKLRTKARCLLGKSVTVTFFSGIYRDGKPLLNPSVTNSGEVIWFLMFFR
jgi:hypothetical protein